MRAQSCFLVLLGVLVLGLSIGVVVLAFEVVATEHSLCRNHNAALHVQRQVLNDAYLGPHHFNTAADIKQRDAIHRRQLAAITAAHC